jgi:hypothetical protein
MEESLILHKFRYRLSIYEETPLAVIRFVFNAKITT